MYMLFDGADAVGEINQNISVAYLSSAWIPTIYEIISN